MSVNRNAGGDEGDNPSGGAQPATDEHLRQVAGTWLVPDPGCVVGFRAHLFL